MNNNVMLMADFYKICHKNLYPSNMEKLYSVWIPRSNRYFPESDKVLWFGLQGFIKEYLIQYFNENFFSQDVNEIVRAYEYVISQTFHKNVDTQKIRDLHALNYLPIEIKALPEGTLVPYGVACMTIENTDPRFAWLTNYLETLLSCSLWHTSTAATVAYCYRKITDKYIKETSDNINWKQVACGDFSFRGMSSLESATTSGAAFLTCFTKTSTIPSILYLNTYYSAKVSEGATGSWNASVEHSCTTSNFQVDGDEVTFFKKMCNEIYPNGNFGFVADSYDYFNFITNILKDCKDDILKREGTVKIRPDSGDPLKIICGDPKGKTEAERKGSLNILWDIFGGVVNSKGYKVLDKHIGLVYGDAITLERCEAICAKMKEMGFAVDNVVFGVGSYSLQYKTRDSQGWALKATYGIVDGKEILIYKDPKTDDGTKKSPRGMVGVRDNSGSLEMYEGDAAVMEQYKSENKLETVFKNGKLWRNVNLSSIRDKVNTSLGETADGE